MFLRILIFEESRGIWFYLVIVVVGLILVTLNFSLNKVRLSILFNKDSDVHFI